MSERNIKTYRTGPKNVTCELFLNFIVFDEHTCRAEATVCWNEPPGAPGAGAAPVHLGAGSPWHGAALPGGDSRPYQSCHAALTDRYRRTAHPSCYQVEGRLTC